MDWPMTSPGWDVADAGLQQALDMFWGKVVWWGTLTLTLVIAGLALLAQAGAGAHARHAKEPHAAGGNHPLNFH